ncbi:MAG: glycoside hydrolase family 15 protein [Chloroflexi bacterium]|nr:glycoside hydrolase family 15 protein [Chloroflexota bacterium]MDA1173695.1 glycoside hydrolase family 15 protein [Chloroflexota bacterium]
MTYRPIHDYGIIGDMNSAALVSLDGSIDWACFPRFDSPSVFAAILDHTKGGRFTISPVGPFTSTQRYQLETTVLETTFTTDHGSVTVIDFMTHSSVHRAEAPHEIVRIVRCDRGAVRMRAEFQPRLDYARGQTSLAAGPYGIVADHGQHRVSLLSAMPFAIEPASDGGQRAVAEFDLAEWQSVDMVAAYGNLPRNPLTSEDVQRKLARSVRITHDIVAGLNYQGRWRDQVIRSVLTLRLLTYDPSGAIIAAPTTSLPEFIGGTRNWDYRYSWLRDSAWTVGILYRVGDAWEGEEYLEWLMKQCVVEADTMQVMYGIAPDSDLKEYELNHLEGYLGASPVRIGNGAASHRQLDVFGEIVLSLATYHRFHGTLSKEAWDLVTRVADLAAASWHLPDNGMWEVRGQQQHFVSSKIMCWVALDRAAKLGEAHDKTGKIAAWRAAAEEIHADILTNGWSDTKQAFVQAYGTDALDASALLIPFVGFLPPDDPRVRSTVQAVQRELADGPFVRRYIAEETDDGFTEGEGAFFILSFWLVGALAFIGEQNEAQCLFGELLSKANHLGLFAEMWDPAASQALGNFPQAFSHIGFIHTARNLSDLPGDTIG